MMIFSGFLLYYIYQPTTGSPTSQIPDRFPIGQSISCVINDPGAGLNTAVYRFIGNNTLSWYPNPTIASSWDQNWGKPISANCTGLTRGPDMQMKT